MRLRCVYDNESLSQKENIFKKKKKKEAIYIDAFVN